MTLVKYNNSRIIPAPKVSINKTFLRNGAGDLIGKVYNISLIGELVAFKGSPTSSGTFHTGTGYPDDENIAEGSRLGAILRKQNALRDLFSDHGQTLSIQSLDATTPLTCNPIVISIDVPEGQWFQTCPYTINLEADNVYPEEDSFTDQLTDAQESWSIDTSEPEGILLPRTYNMSHTVSAVGKAFYSTSGTLDVYSWQRARTWVLSRLGFDAAIALSSGVNNLPSYYGGYNHIRSENIDKSNGGFSVTETWILASGTATEDFTVEVSDSVEDPYTRVSIGGSVQGLEQRNAALGLTVTKHDNALTKFASVSGLALARAQSYSGKTLNSSPRSVSRGINPVAGTISYNYDFDDRPGKTVTKARSESVSIDDSFGVDAFATIPILGRAKGPLMQSLGSRQVCQRSLTIDLIMDRDYIPTTSGYPVAFKEFNPRYHHPQSGEIISIINAVIPFNNAYNNIGILASGQYVSSQNESWDAIKFHYTRNITWDFE